MPLLRRKALPSGNATGWLASLLDAEVRLRAAWPGYRERFLAAVGEHDRLARNNRRVYWLATGFAVAAVVIAAVVVVLDLLVADEGWSVETAMILVVLAALSMLIRSIGGYEQRAAQYQRVVDRLVNEGECFARLSGRRYRGRTHAERLPRFIARVEATFAQPEGRQDRAYRVKRKPAERQGRLFFYVKVMFYALAGPDNEDTDRTSSLRMSPPRRGTEAQQELERIGNRTRDLSEQRAGFRLWRTAVLLSSAGIPLAAVAVVPIREENVLTGVHVLAAISLGFLEFFLLTTWWFVRRQVINLNNELQLLEYDAVLAKLSEVREKTAANLFFKHQAEVKQYYDQTLRQNRQAFALGVLCVLFGLGCVVTVAILLLSDHHTEHLGAKITASALAGVAAALTGFIARVYSKVYEESAKALGKFHERLVNTNHFHFANLLVATIPAESVRIDSLAKLAASVGAPAGETENGAKA